MTSITNSHISGGPDYPKLTHERKTGPSIEHFLIAVLGILSALMLGISLSILGNETGPLANFKILLVTGSAGIVAYAVNRFAIERGAPLLAIGFRLGGVSSIAAMLIVGLGMFIGAFTGLVHNQVDERILQGNGTVLASYSGTVNKAALEAGRAGPALRLTADDLTRLASCENKSSCLSKKGNGGHGLVAGILEKLAARAHAIASAFESGKVDRSRLLADINKLNARYQDTLGDTDMDIRKRRATLQTIHAEIEQTSSTLSEALPISLVMGFSRELLNGTVVPGQPATTQRLNAILRQHGSTLADVLGTLSDNEISPPSFPARPGMLEPLKFLGEFAAYAAVIFVAELCLPITLFTLTYLKLVWDIERYTPPRPPADKSDGFGGLIDLPPAPPPNGNNSGTTRPNGSSHNANGGHSGRPRGW